MIKPNESTQSERALPSIADRINSNGLSPLARDIDSLTTTLNQHWSCLPSEAKEQLLAAFSRIEGKFLQNRVVLDGMISRSDIGEVVDMLIEDEEEELNILPLPGNEIVTALEQVGLLDVGHVLNEAYDAVSCSMEAYETNQYAQKVLKKELSPVLKRASEQGLLPSQDAGDSDFNME